MIIANNIVAMNAQRQFGVNTNSKAKKIEKLSSGYRINRAADDAASLAISEKMRRQIRGLNQGAENICDGISLCQVADGALDEVDSLLQRMNELSVHSANGSLDTEDRSYIQKEVNALIGEINRIGATTTFNEVHIFDHDKDLGIEGDITNLVSSPAAETGHMTEAYHYGSSYYPAATIDFSGVNAVNVSRLDGGYFTFNCTQSCNEQFTIKFDASATTDSRKDIGNNHNYTVSLQGIKSGAELVDHIYAAVQRFPVGASNELGGLKVSHSNVLVKDGSNRLIVAATSGYATEALAKNHFSGPPLNSYNPGGIDVSSLTNITSDDPRFIFPIQCSSDVDDVEYVTTRKMNGKSIGVDPLDVSTESAARAAIGKVKSAIINISEQRTEIGATQNRLEHTYNTNLNTSENTQSAESLIRDADMAKLMVGVSVQNILEQSGIAMMTQANQSAQGVLSLLQ